MQTVYDWVTVAIFAGLVVLFIQRATSEEEQPKEHDSLLLYLGAALGCAVANYVGNKGLEADNQGMQVLAIALIGATILFIVYYLRPFKFWPRT